LEISSSYPYPTKWGFSSCCDKDSAIIYTTGRLLDVLETGVELTIANATGTNGLTCLLKHGGARDNECWSPILRLAIETGA
jgi:hypothetical protein